MHVVPAECDMVLSLLAALAGFCTTIRARLTPVASSETDEALFEHADSLFSLPNRRVDGASRCPVWSSAEGAQLTKLLFRGSVGVLRVRDIGAVVVVGPLIVSAAAVGSTVARVWPW